MDDVPTRLVNDPPRVEIMLRVREGALVAVILRVIVFEVDVPTRLVDGPPRVEIILRLKEEALVVVALLVVVLVWDDGATEVEVPGEDVEVPEKVGVRVGTVE